MQISRTSDADLTALAELNQPPEPVHIVHDFLPASRLVVEETRLNALVKSHVVVVVHEAH